MNKVLTPARRARLEKLATYLEKLPANYGAFTMAEFIAQDDEVAREKSEAEYGRTNGGIHTCGTAACAAGHGPAAGILVPPRFISGSGIWWSRYCTLFIGDDYIAEDFLFSGAWSRHDNTHYGAAARIRYLLAHGKPPSAWDGYEYGGETMAAYAPYRIDAKVALSPTPQPSEEERR